LTAAEELAHTGECAPDEIYAVAQELEAHVSSFAARVEQRRRRLDLAVVFYTHEKEVYFYHLSRCVGVFTPSAVACKKRVCMCVFAYTHMHVRCHF